MCLALQSLRGHQAEGLHFLGHRHVCGRPGGEHPEEHAQGAPSVHAGPGEESREHGAASSSECFFSPLANSHLTPSPRRACTAWRTRSSSASPASWATAASPTSFTWRWSPTRRSSWWRAPRPCGVCRRSWPCEERPSEEQSPSLRGRLAPDQLPPPKRAAGTSWNISKRSFSS